VKSLFTHRLNPLK